MDTFKRLFALLNEDQINKIQNAKICIVGIGGVGSVATETLARCGIGNFILCDFDTVAKSNINRQIIANQNTIGRFKVDVAKEKILEINPNAKVEIIKEKFSSELSLFDFKFDYLIDAIDDINNKFLLIKTCLEKDIKFISSMGTAKKFDSSLLKVVDINKTSYDPLARKIRKMLRDNNINKKFMVVSSTEEPKNSDILGSYMVVTAYSGLLLADYILKQIINSK